MQNPPVSLPDLQKRLAQAFAAQSGPVTAAAAPRALPPKDDATPISWREFTRGHAGFHSRAILATLAINVLALAGSLVVMNVYDRVLPNQAIETLTALCIGALIAAIFEFSLRMLRGVLIDAASQETDIRLAHKLFARVIGAKLTQGGSTGVKINTLREFETLRDFFNSATLTTLGDLPFALLFIAMIGVLAGPLVWVPLIIIPVLMLASLALHRPMAELTATSFRDTAQKNAILVETLVGIETIKGLGAEAHAKAQWQKAVEEHVRVGLKTRLLGALGQNFVSTTQSVATLALLGWGVILVGQGAVTAGALMASMTLLGRAMGPVAQAAMLLGRLHQARTAWSALQQLASVPLERPDSTDFVQSSKRFSSFALEDVGFAYGPEAPPALNSVSLTIKTGERIGIIGGIGSGKSTILKLLLKLHEPQGGRVLVDGLAIAGVDPARLRQDIGLIEQSPILFSGTIRMNLTLHCPDASNDTILAACERAGALSWIARLPRGFDTALGERGAGLSAGQKQSLAVARALVGEPSILLMDEPTSDMDGRSEGEILTRLKSILPGKTLVLVTHRPALLELVDRLIVMDAGKVVADGPKAQVLELLRQRNAQPSASAQPAPAAEPVAAEKAMAGRRASKGAGK